jgi:hypothetical protein
MECSQHGIKGFSGSGFTNPSRDRSIALAMPVCVCGDYVACGCPVAPAEILLHTVGDAALAEVIRRQFDLDAVAGEDANVVFAHTPRDVGGEDVSVVEFNPEHGIRQGFEHLSFHFNDVFFGHGFAGFAKEAVLCHPKPATETPAAQLT